MRVAYVERWARFALGFLAASLLLAALVRFVPGGPVATEISLRTSRLVAEMVAEALPGTLGNLAMGVGLALPLALLLGIPAGLRPHGLLDRALQGPAVALAGVPAFTAVTFGIRSLALDARIMSLPGAGRATLVLLLAAWLARAVRNGLAGLAVGGGRPSAGRGALAVAGAILQQTGNILLITMLVETAVPGGSIFRLLTTGMMTRDLPVVYGALWPVVLLGLAGHLLGDLLVTAAGVGRAEAAGGSPVGGGVGPASRPSRTWLAVGALLGLGLLVPLFWGAGGDAVTALALPDRLQPPGPGHLLGTDPFGRDLLSRIGYGTRLSLTIAMSGTMVATVGGLLLAGVGHALGRWGRAVLSPRGSVPGLLGPVVAGMVAVLLFRPVVVTLILALGLASIPAAARAFRRLFEPGGPADRPGLAFLGLLVLTFAQILLAESILSYLGIGVQPPLPSLGNLVMEAMPYVRTAPHLLWGAVPGALGLAGLFLVGHTLSEPAQGEG